MANTCRCSWSEQSMLNTSRTKAQETQTVVQTHLCRMRPLMGSRASYTVRASFTQSLGSITNEVMVRRIREPGTAVSFTWQFIPPHDGKMFKGTVTPGRLAYILSTHCESERREKKNTNANKMQTCRIFLIHLNVSYLLCWMSNPNAEQLQKYRIVLFF